jgi:hypothetical protein
VTLEIVLKRASHIDDAERRVIHLRSQFPCVDEPREVQIFKRKGLGIERGRLNKKAD